MACRDQQSIKLASSVIIDAVRVAVPVERYTDR